jgi:hypothetical protein
MPHYFLKLRSRNQSGLPNDPDPEFHPSLAAAQAEAAESIRQMASEAIAAGFRFSIGAIDVTDQAGKVLVSVPVSEALANYVGH